MPAYKELIEKFKTSPALKSGLALTVARGFLIASNFFIFFILVRLCSPADFGTWILYSSIVVIFEVANNSFVSNAIVKYYHDYQDTLRGVFIFNAFIFTIALSLLFSVILYLSIHLINAIYHSNQLNDLLLFAPLILFASGLTNAFNCIEQGNMRFYGQLVVSVVKSMVFISYLFYLLITETGYSLENFVMISIISGYLALLIVYSLTKKFFCLTRRFDLKIIQSIAKYGFFTFGIEVIGQISNNIGQLIAGALLSPAAVGIVNVATRVLQFIEIPLQAVSAVLMPQGVITMKEKGMAGIKTLYEKSSAFIIVVMLPVLVLFFIFSDQVIYLIAGKDFHEASLLLKIILVYSLFKPFGRNSGVILNAIGKTKINFFMVLIPTVINLLLNYYLIKKLGVVGSPIATLIATLVGFVFNQYVMYRIANINLKAILLETRNFYQKFFNFLLVKNNQKV